MLMFSFIIAMFPRHLPRIGLSIPESSTNIKQLRHEEQPLTKSMLSDFMPNDPAPTKQKEILHIQETSAKKVKGMILIYSSVSSASNELGTYFHGAGSFFRSHSATQEIPRPLWDPEVRYRVHRNLPLILVLSQLNPVHTLQPCFPKINSNIILPSMPGSSNWYLPFRFPDQMRLLMGNR
jgi:hypothetical protein